MPGALTNTKSTWALSPMAHKSRVSLQGPPCAHGVAGTPYGEVRNTFCRSQADHLLYVKQTGEYLLVPIRG